MDTQQIIRENLKNWMTESPALKSQTAIAAKAKVGQSHISRILRGESNPTIEMLEAIAGAFRRSLIDILTEPVSYSTQKAIHHLKASEPSDDEKTILDGYKEATTEVKEIMLDAAKRSLEKKRNDKKQTAA